MNETVRLSYELTARCFLWTQSRASFSVCTSASSGVSFHWSLGWWRLFRDRRRVGRCVPENEETLPLHTAGGGSFQENVMLLKLSKFSRKHGSLIQIRSGSKDSACTPSGGVASTFRLNHRLWQHFQSVRQTSLLSLDFLLASFLTS